MGYTNRLLLHFCVCVSVFDESDDEAVRGGGYEDVYSMRRVQEIISRKSVEGVVDDHGKLSQTLSKLVETCSGLRVMRLWSENPRVCTARFTV